MSDSGQFEFPWRAAAVAAAAVAVALLVWFLLIRGDDDSDPGNGPRIVDAGEIAERASELGRPIYWVGERDGAHYELSESSAGRIYVRYLDEGAEPGVRSTEFLTVATYPSKDAVAALEKAAEERGDAELARSDDGATVLINTRTPGSVHLAHPGSDWQVEVYSPDPEAGLRLVKDGAVQPVE